VSASSQSPADGVADTRAPARAAAGESWWSQVAADAAVTRLECAEITGDAAQLADVRSRLRKWAIAVGMRSEDADDLELASYEALANAAEHAYPAGRPRVDLKAVATFGGGVLVTVRDHGHWRPPPTDPGFRGRGLGMIRALAHRSEIERTETGTVVHMQWFGPDEI
jgi:serine/threonine-protein kinase RsbW